MNACSNCGNNIAMYCTPCLRKKSKRIEELEAELKRVKRCYESATGKPVCGDGDIARVECKQMGNLRTALEDNNVLIQDTLSLLENGHIESAIEGLEVKK